MTENILEIGKKDLKIVQKIVFETWPVAYGEILSQAQLTYMLDKFYNIESLEATIDEGHRYFLYSANDIPLGFLGVQAGLETDSLKIHKLYVLPQNQGKNIGLKLFQYAENLTKLMNLKRVFLNVNRFNKAKNFYEKIGMKICKVEDIEIGNGYLMEDFVMEKKL
jgi:GNAT superfamily N-acetyltransferase